MLSKTRGAVEAHLFTALCSALCIVPVLHSNMIDTSTASALFLEVFFSFNVNVLRTEITFHTEPSSGSAKSVLLISSKLLHPFASMLL